MPPTEKNPGPPGDAEKPLLVEKAEGIATIRLNRPRRRNTLSTDMLLALKEAVEDCGSDAAVRAIVLCAEGPVFSSGHDMKQLVGARPEAARGIFDLSTSIMLALQRLPKPVIAQVSGLASAAGCQLVASCDLVVASSEARFQTPGVMIGLFCSTPMVPLSRAVPAKKAMEMLLTGQPIGAEEAREAGLVNRVVEPGELEAETRALATRIISHSAYTLAVGKEAFYKQLPLPLEAAYEVGKEAITRNALAPDGQEGMSAFLQKRPPKWKGD